VIAILIGSWFFIAFMIGMVISFVGCPRWLELPWSVVRDYVETTDGRVYVALAFYSCVVCYDKEGNFVATYSWPLRNAKGTKLAAGKSGLLYFLGNNAVYAYDRNWKIVFDAEENPAKERRWKLAEDSKPFFDVGAPGLVPDRAVGPNELLFSPSQPRNRRNFLCVTMGRCCSVLAARL